MIKVWLTVLAVVVLIVFLQFIKSTNSNNQQIQTLTSLPATAFSKKEPLLVKASIPYWDQEKAVKTFKENIDKINIVSLFWYFVEGTGEIKEYQYAKVDNNIIKFAHDNNVKVEIVITNLPEVGGWDSDRVKKVIRDDNLRQQHIEKIVALAESLGVDGVDIDYEQLDENLKDDFSKFINELTTSLHAEGKYLGVALHPKSADGIGNGNGSSTQDWNALSKSADNLYIMAFGEHWDEGEPGPVASLPWVERVVKYALSLGLNKRKLFLTIPLYGYSWRQDSDDKAEGLTHSDVTKLLKRYKIEDEWDDQSKSPHFNYQSSADYEVWFENARSVEEKIGLADKAGFAGISFWRLGGEDPKLWENLKSKDSH